MFGPRIILHGVGKYAMSQNWLAQEIMLVSVLNSNFVATKTCNFGQDIQYVT